VPFYMDRHELEGVTAADVAAAHMKDLDVQARYDVQFVNYWFDYERQHAFCLARAPDAEAVAAVHAAAHGLVANQVITVDEDSVMRFMGGMSEHSESQPYAESAFRAILFTDLEGSTGLTQKVGDASAMAVLRRHDEIVRDALARTRGTEVKHTGDGIMASFRSIADAVAAALAIQRRLADAEREGKMPVGVRIGIAAGEPVTERNDLFGAAVQLAARLTSRAEARTILASSAVRDLAQGKGFRFGPTRSMRLKGFVEPIRASEVLWQADSDETA
jgi:class 3 adenylate cyclase